MQKEFMNAPNTFPFMKEKNIPSYVVLEHIKRSSNLIKQRVPDKEQLMLVTHE